jgi:hypothetical protein
MKTLVSVLLAGALTVTGGFAGALGWSAREARTENTVAGSKLPFRLFHKRPSGAGEVTVTSKVNLATPQVPFRSYQKRPTGTSNSKPSGLEATAR